MKPAAARTVMSDLAASYADFMDGSGARPARVFVPSEQLIAFYSTPTGRDSTRSIVSWLTEDLGVEVIEDATPDASLRWRAAPLPQ